MRLAALLVVVMAAVAPQRAAADDVTWNAEEWGTFGTAELAALAFLAAGTMAAKLYLEPGTPRRGGVLLDDSIRQGLRLESAAHRRAFAITSDVLLASLVAWPFADAIGHSLTDGDPRVSEQVSLISALSYSVTWFLNSVVKNVASRQRPWGEECQSSLGAECGSPDRYRSFYSGHAALSFTAAGLVCTHHANLGLYRDQALDIAACSVGLAVATALSVFRLMADSHYFSELVVGAIVGVLTGVLVPTALRYGSPSGS